jgi:hypothetical protein
MVASLPPGGSVEQSAAEVVVVVAGGTMTVGGVDTYYDYDEKQWKSRRLGGGPIRRGPVCPAPKSAVADHEPKPPSGTRSHARTAAGHSPE